MDKSALQAVEGFLLTAENYSKEWKLLNDRCDNQQLIISSHMNNIINLSTVLSPNTAKHRHIYNKAESNVRSLKGLDLNYQQFSSLLIPISVGKLPNVLKLYLGRNLGRENWDIDLFSQCFNDEIIA